MNESFEIGWGGDFLQATKLEYKSMLPGSKLTTFCIGGPIACLIEPESMVELSRVLHFFSLHDINWRIVGAGSNLLIPDSGIIEPVIRLGRGFRYMKEVGPALFEIGASTPLMTLSSETCRAGLSGLEFAGGIPATVGGALRMNAGAHGGQISDVVESVLTLAPSGEAVEFKSTDLSFGYRFVSLPSDHIIIGCTLKLGLANASETMARRSEALNYRKLTQPLHLPSAGSVFRNPDGDIAAGKLLEESGVKGMQIGGAEVSMKHANWIVNRTKRATASNVSSLIEQCRNIVKSKFGIDLSSEIVEW